MYNENKKNYTDCQNYKRDTATDCDNEKQNPRVQKEKCKTNITHTLYQILDRHHYYPKLCELLLLL